MVTPTKLEQHIQEWASFTFFNYVRPPELLASLNDTPPTLKTVAMPAKHVRIIANWITMMAVHRSGGYHHIIGALSAYDMATIFAVAYCYNDIYKAPLCEGLYEWGKRLAAYFNTNKLGVTPMDVIDLLRHNWWDTQRCEWCMQDPIEETIFDDCIICNRAFYFHQNCMETFMPVCPLCTRKPSRIAQAFGLIGVSGMSLRDAVSKMEVEFQR